MPTPPLSADPAERKEVFSSEELAQVDFTRVPRHIAILMDGNRRWARMKKLAPMVGHWEGAEVLDHIVRAAVQLGVKTLTVYAFSTENWNRSDSEIESLMNIFEMYLLRKKEMMVREGICLDAIGDLTRLPSRVRSAFDQTRQATRNCQKINLILALNYGGRDEIRRAILQILERNDEKKILPEELTEHYISQFLDTKRWGDPELFIRTSGELRVSNFLLWQLSYSEFYVTDVLWPAFAPKDLLQAVIAFQTRQRRLGGG
ncbi:MAG: uppS [Parachlamydiales bacterium]|nr:uppS [Parachlamydiales bacterium]